MPAPTPPLLPSPIAVDALPANITATIPTSPTGTNAASILAGFPPVTMNPELAGGLPPLGQDFNAYFFLLSSHTLYLEAGQLYTYNLALSTAIGGYLAGTILGMADGTGTWLNLVPNNTTNPDTGGAGWVAISSYGFATVSGLVGGTIPLTPDQYRKTVIVLQGALVSPLTIAFPITLQQWLVVNQTTGGQPVTAKTAAGTGVNIPPGGGFASPVGVYGDGTNLYPTVAPLAVAIAQAPTPLTLAERTNVGALLATFFNSSEAVTDPAVVNVIVDAGDGNFQKIALVNFLMQLGVISITGTVATGEAVIGGVIRLKWGFINYPGAGGASAAFTNPFPTGCIQVFTTTQIGGFSLGQSAFNSAGVTFGTNGLGGTAQRIGWFAIGF